MINLIRKKLLERKLRKIDSLGKALAVFCLTNDRSVLKDFTDEEIKEMFERMYRENLKNDQRK